MPQWLAKGMSAEEWPIFQGHFEGLFLAHRADPEMALFKANQAGKDTALLLVPGRWGDLVRDISGSAWQPFAYPEALSWTLLVGNHDAAERLGLTK